MQFAICFTSVLFLIIDLSNPSAQWLSASDGVSVGSRMVNGHYIYVIRDLGNFNSNQMSDKQDEKNTKKITLFTGYGTTAKASLPDGSLVLLNAYFSETLSII